MAAAALLVMLLVHRFVSVGRVLLIAVTAVALMYVAAPDYTVRLASLTNATDVAEGSAGAADAAARGRAAESLAAWNVFVGHPAVGVGPGQFFREYSQIETNKLGLRTVDTNRRAHNLYLELAADQGVLGVATFVGLSGTTVVGLVRARRRWRGVDREREMLAGGLLFAMYAYLATGVFLHLSYQRYFWAVLAVANGAIWALGRTPSTSDGLGPVPARPWLAPSPNGTDVERWSVAPRRSDPR